MSVTEVPAKFKTRDGRSFDDKVEAEQHEAVLAAFDAFQESLARLGRLVANSIRTADGEKFNIGRLGDYWYISRGWAGMPELSRVSFYVWNCHFDTYDGKRDLSDFAIYQSKDNRTTSYKVSELYAKQKKAQLALLTAQQEYVAECQTKIGQLQAELQD